MARASKAPAGDQAVLSEELPSGLYLVRIYGFVDEYGDRWHWDVGQLVRNPFVIAMLMKRRAPVVVIGESLA